jgi:hypothetical protein
MAAIYLIKHRKGFPGLRKKRYGSPLLTHGGNSMEQGNKNMAARYLIKHMKGFPGLWKHR